MYSYAQLLTRNHAEAADLLQEALLRGFRAFGSYKPHLSVKFWLCKIMKNAHLDRARRLRVRRTAEKWNEDAEGAGDVEQAGLYAVPSNPEEILLRGLTIEEVKGAIRRLPTVFREVVELREIEAFSYREIAEIIGTPIGTVMSRLYRGRHLLRSYLHEPERGSGGELKSGHSHGL